MGARARGGDGDAQEAPRERKVGECLQRQVQEQSGRREVLAVLRPEGARRVQRDCSRSLQVRRSSPLEDFHSVLSRHAQDGPVVRLQRL